MRSLPIIKQSDPKAASLSEVIKSMIYNSPTTRVQGEYLIYGFTDEYGGTDPEEKAILVSSAINDAATFFVISPTAGIVSGNYMGNDITWTPVTRLVSEKISLADLADAVVEQIDQFQMIPQGADLLNVSLGKGVYFTQDEKYLNIPTGITGYNPMCMIVDNNGSKLLLGTSTAGDFISARKNSSTTSWIICNYYNEIASKQNSTDNTLTTTSKTIVGAVNEVNTLAKSKASSSVATISANGLMSSADKVKLDGIASGAQVNVLDGMTVNGEAATIANKKIAVANGTSKGTFTVGGKTVTIGGLDKVDNTSDAEKQVYEANLQWGGKNLTATFSPVDAAMMPELGANRFAYLNPAGIEVEYSRDGGETWIDYGLTDEQKSTFFSPGGYTLYLGKENKAGINKSSYQLRITITSDVALIYTVLNKFIIFISRNGSNFCWCTIDKITKANVDAGGTNWERVVTKQSIDGWSGYNVINTNSITLYNYASSHYQKLRFTFGARHELAAEIQYSGLEVKSISAFGGQGWKTPSNLAKWGHAYSMDAFQNCTFPAKVNAFGIDAGSQKVTRVITPTESTDAANKAYVDGLVGNISTVLTNIIGE